MLLSDRSLVQELDNLDDVYEDLTETSQSALSEDDCMDLVVVPPIHEDTHQLPFPEVSVEWYKRQNILSTKNASRENIQHPCYDEGGAIQYIDRSRVDDTIEENKRIEAENGSHQRQAYQGTLVFCSESW